MAITTSVKLPCSCLKGGLTFVVAKTESNEVSMYVFSGSAICPECGRQELFQENSHDAMVAKCEKNGDLKKVRL